MDVSMQLRDLANSVGEDFAMNAPDDTARLVGKARRGRMVWSTGVGTAVVGSAASLAFGGPALASVLTSGPAVAPAASTSVSASDVASASPSADASASPSASAESTPESTPETTPETSPDLGSTSLGGVPAGMGDDDGAEGSDDSSTHSTSAPALGSAGGSLGGVPAGVGDDDHSSERRRPEGSDRLDPCRPSRPHPKLHSARPILTASVARCGLSFCGPRAIAVWETAVARVQWFLGSLEPLGLWCNWQHDWFWSS